MKTAATYATVHAPLPVVVCTTVQHLPDELLYLPVNTVVRYTKTKGPLRLEALVGPFRGSFTAQPKTFAARTHPATALELLSLHANE